MDAYDLYQEIFKAWQQVAHTHDAATLKKKWNETPVYVDGKAVTGVKIIDGRIELETR